MQSLLVMLEDTKIWLCYLYNFLVALLQNNDSTPCKWVMQRPALTHQGCELMLGSFAHDLHYLGLKSILASKPYKDCMRTQSSGTMTLTDEEIKRYS